MFLNSSLAGKVKRGLSYAIDNAGVTGAISNVYVYITKQDNMVEISVSLYGTDIDSGQVLATINADYRPVNEQWIRNAYDNQQGEIIILPNGQIKYESNNAGCNYLRAKAVYFTL